MTVVDIFAAAVLLAFCAKGFMNGLVREVCSLLGLVAGGWCAFRYRHLGSEFFKPLIQLPEPVAAVLSFIVILVLVALLFSLIGHLVTVVMKVVLLGGINRVGGVAFGLLEGGLVISILLALSASPSFPKARARIEKSKSGPFFVSCGREIISGWEKRRKAFAPHEPAPGKP